MPSVAYCVPVVLALVITLGVSLAFVDDWVTCVHSVHCVCEPYLMHSTQVVDKPKCSGNMLNNLYLTMACLPIIKSSGAFEEYKTLV